METDFTKDLTALDCIFFTKDKEKENKILYSPFQACILNRLNKNNFAMSFDEPGAGKTVEGIYAIWNILRKKKNGENLSVLVVTLNKTLAEKWKKEIEKFLGLDFTVANNESTNEETYRFNDDGNNLYITFNGKYTNSFNRGICKLNLRQDYLLSLDNFIAEPEPFPACPIVFETTLKECKWDLIILDEIHGYYKTYKEVLKHYPTICPYEGKRLIIQFSHRCDKLLLLTATPKNKNELYELAKDMLTGGNYNYNHNHTYDTKSRNLLTDFENAGPEQLFFKEIIKGTEAKTRTVNVLKYDAGGLKKFWYYAKRNINKPIGNNAGNIFTLMNSLNKDEADILGLYNKNDKYTPEEAQKLIKFDTKTGALIAHLKSEQENGTLKCIIFRVREDIQTYLCKIINALLPDVTVYTISQAENDRNKTYSDFNSDTGNKILLSSWELSGTGINLPGADEVIAYELPYAAADVQQGFGRIDRFNSTFNEISMTVFWAKTDNQKELVFDSYYFYSMLSKWLKSMDDVASKNVFYTKEMLLALKKQYKDIIDMYNKMLEAWSDKEKVTEEEEINPFFEKNPNFKPFYPEIWKHTETSDDESILKTNKIKFELDEMSKIMKKLDDSSLEKFESGVFYNETTFKDEVNKFIDLQSIASTADEAIEEETELFKGDSIFTNNIKGFENYFENFLDEDGINSILADIKKTKCALYVKCIEEKFKQINKNLKNK